MARVTSSIAKITRPRLPDVLSRTRLFRLLNGLRKQSPVIWVSGPAGSGKTTLVSSYLDSHKLPSIWYQTDEGDADLATFFFYMGLAARKAAPRYKRPLPLFTPEYGLGIPTFTRRFFENLCSRLKPPYVLVFDNYQEIPSDSMLHELMRIGLSALPENICTVIISRSEPPAAFSGMQAGNKLHVIGWNDLKLTLDESKGIIKLQNIGKSNPFEWLHEKTQGWVAGMVLLMRAAKSEGIEPGTVKDLAPEKVFDYFANELFSRLDAPMQDFLLRTAFVPKITPGLAEELTGNKAAGGILSELNRRNFFTEKRSQPELSYQYHALFREFLITRAASRFRSDELSGFQLEAGKLLEQSGQTEAAAELYIRAADWTGLLGLLMNCAPLFVTQGRTQLLAQWLTAIPERIAAVNGWVLYWKAVCKLVFDPNEARPIFEQAFALFTKEQSLPGRLLAWSGIVDTYLHAWNDFTPLDRWIDAFDELWKQGAEFPSRDIEIRITTSVFGAIFLRSPWRSSLPYWESCATKLLTEGIDISAYPLLGYFLMLYYTLKGDFEKASAMYHSVSRAVRSAADNPVLAVIGKAIEAYYWWFSGSREKSMQAVNVGLTAANSAGLHLWDHMFFAIGAYNMLAAGDHLAAKTYLRGMESTLDPRRFLDVTHYHYNLSWSAVVSGDLARAREQGDLFMQIPETSAHFFINLNLVAMAHVLVLGNEQKRAAALLREVRTFLNNVDSALLEFKYHLARAHVALTGEDDRAYVNALRMAFAIGQDRRIYHFDWWLPAIMQRLCADALEQDIEAAYVRELIRRNELQPEADRPVPSSWPWPIKIFTLGQFSLELDGKAVMFGGKTPKKPLELLKAIIALGGRDVSEERIMDALWPEALGDLAYKSFEIALQRLRKLLNSDKAVRRQDGLLTLDDRCCWTDVWAFEKLAHDAEYPSPSPLPSGEMIKVREKSAIRNLQSEIMQRYEKALRIYKGHFLPADTRQPWITLPRERLRSKFLLLVSKTGEQYERKSEWKKAVECFEQGLERDPVCEEFYQRLMICHDKLGHRSEAVKTYHRCRAALRDGLGLEPSTKTEEIHSSLLHTR